jgi:hypothetical protein
MTDDVIYNITKLVNEQFPKTESEITEYGDYSILKGEDGTYDVEYYGEGIIGEYLSTIEEAIAVADRHKSTIESKPAVELKSAGGAKFKIRLDEDEDTDYSMTTASDIGIKPGVQELFNSNPELANQVYEALGFTQKNQEITTSEISDLIKTKEIEYLDEDNKPCRNWTK